MIYSVSFTASLGADYSFDAVVVIPVDQAQACSNVSLIDDNVAEETQAFNLSIVSASPSASIDSIEFYVVVEILDDDGTYVKVSPVYWCHIHIAIIK